MKNVPPVLHGNEWDWPSDGNADAWPDYLKEIPVRRLFRQAEHLDKPFDRGVSDYSGRKVFE